MARRGATGVGGDDPWSMPADGVLAHLGTALDGLSTGECERRLLEVGANRIGAPRHASDAALLRRQASDPIVLLLVVATVLSAFLGEVLDASIILLIVVASAGLGFLQERGAVHAVQALMRSVRVHADVRRDGVERQVPLEAVVPGEIVVLNAGDVVPADCRVLSASALQVDQAPLTGESRPVRKVPGEIAATRPLGERTNALFLGSHVVSGTATAVAVTTGADTVFGSIGERLDHTEPPTSFERGLRGFGVLLVRAGGVLVAIVLAVNLIAGRPVFDSLLFSLALAVGITPQLLPAIVTLTLSRGARAMARERVVVKRLSSIEDLGGMDVLCVDKTGTLTEGSVRLDAALSIDGSPSDRVAALAWLNATHQRGFENPLDMAIEATVPSPADPGRRLGEVPYDFERKRLTVVVDTDTGVLMVTKGAVTSVREVCVDAVAASGQRIPIADAAASVDATVESLTGRGARVLAVAVRDLGVWSGAVSPDDERGLTLVGLLAFVDPPKAGAAATLAALADAGVSVRMITGDSLAAAMHVAAAVGLDCAGSLTGEEVDALDDAALADAMRVTTVVAEVDPLHKQRIVRALAAAGHDVGFMGDGINDALALRSADVGISVDTAVDVAKEAASIVLLDKDLAVLLGGIRRGRRCFANTLKYVFVTTSANFGNMLSMAGATLVLPFLPMLPRQILLLNFLSDIPGMTIASDEVDAEQLVRPTQWDIRLVRTVMVVFGLVSSVFDVLTFVTLRAWLGADAELFRSGWFLVSVGTELLAMLVLRTRRPFIRSRPGAALLWSSVAVAAVAWTLPYTPLAGSLGLDPPGVLTSMAMVALLVGYATATELAKRWFLARPATANAL